MSRRERADAGKGGRQAWLSRVATSSPVMIAVALVGVAALIGAWVAGVVADEATRLVTRQIVQALAIELHGLEDLDRIAGDRAVAGAVESRTTSEPRSGPAGRLYLMVDRDGRRIGGGLGAEADAVLGGSDGGLFRYRPASEEGAARWAVGVRGELASGSRVIVARDVEDVRAFAERLRWLFVVALAVLAAAGIGLGVLVSRRLEARIERVRQTADRIMAGDLAHRIPVSGAGDELDRLAERLNRMLDRIEDLMNGMREISDNIAHDLKTPVSRLRTRAEAALREGGSDGAHREALVHTIEAADEIIQTFNALLLIARLEAGVARDSFATFDLAGLTRDLADLYEPAADEARMRVVVEAPDRVLVSANRHLIGQALSNLVDNAIKYGRDGSGPGEIVIAVEPQADRVVLRVRDRGPGIPAEARRKVLGRFVRLDQSRSQPGTGLGLSLVAAVARLHGAELRLTDNAPGLVVEFDVPAAVEDDRGPAAHAGQAAESVP